MGDTRAGTEAGAGGGTEPGAGGVQRGRQPVRRRPAAAGPAIAAALAAGLAARISATEPSRAAAARCCRLIPGSRGVGRRATWAPISTSTEKANVAQPNQPTSASARMKSWPSSRLVSTEPISVSGGQVVRQRVAGEGEQGDRRADRTADQHDSAMPTPVGRVCAPRRPERLDAVHGGLRSGCATDRHPVMAAGAAVASPETVTVRSKPNRPSIAAVRDGDPYPDWFSPATTGKLTCWPVTSGRRGHR